MSDRFAASALQLAAFAAAHLGWTPRSFWAATPSELAACLTPPLLANPPPSRAEIAALIERDAHG